MNVFSYKMEHDYGLAPNPFGGYLTLAVCKKQIRKNHNLTVGDWIVGTGSCSLGNLNHLIYAMKVEELLTFDEYWNDERFQCKKPNLNGSLVMMYGDNIYHTDESTGQVIQELCAHSAPKYRDKHIKSDTSGLRVPISQHFFYFGDSAPLIPEELQEVCCKARDYQYAKIPEDVKNRFIEWLEGNFETGVWGDPISWGKYYLPPLDIYEGE